MSEDKDLSKTVCISDCRQYSTGAKHIVVLEVESIVQNYNAKLAVMPIITKYNIDADYPQ